MKAEDLKEILKATEEEAEKRKVFFYYDNRCMEHGCDKPADFIITVWFK